MFDGDIELNNRAESSSNVPNLNNVIDDNVGEGPSNVDKLPDQSINKGKEKDDKKPFEPIRGIFSS